MSSANQSGTNTGINPTNPSNRVESLPTDGSAAREAAAENGLLLNAPGRNTLEIRKHALDGVVFDLDGVITSTARLHYEAWQDMFDRFLEARLEEGGEGDCSPFTKEDYLNWVDGKPRYEGVKAFLLSRGIEDVPFGFPSDDPDAAGPLTMCRLGNRKNNTFNQMLDSAEIEVYASSVELVKELRDQGLKYAIATSSKNGRKVLRAARDPETSDPLITLFDEDMIVDGVYSAEHGLKGKPNPDIFLEAARLAGIRPHRGAVVEDAVSGVEAARKGNFGLVIGVAREHNTEALRKAGADIIEPDLGAVPLSRIDQWFEQEGWRLTWRGEDLALNPAITEQHARAMSQTSVRSIGNGFFCTRGADPEPGAHRRDYHATYITNVLNELVTPIQLKPGEPPRNVSNEDLVNCIDWLPLTFKIDDGPWFDPTTAKIVSGKKTLCLDDGSLVRELVVCDKEGRETSIVSKMCASMADPHLAALEYTVNPLNYSGTITVQSGLRADHKNEGVVRYSKYDQRHVRSESESQHRELSALVAKTTDSGITIATAARLYVTLNGEKIDPKFRCTTAEGAAETTFTQHVEQGQMLTVNKVVGISTSSEGASESNAPDRMRTSNSNPAKTALLAVNNEQFPDYAAVHRASAERWKALWDAVDVRVEGGDRLTQQLLRLHLYHSLLTASPANIDLKLDASIGPRGLTGETYRGHVFWDTEMYILPQICAHQPEVARQLLEFRYKRLDAAREYARENGYQGAMIPWNVGLVGNEQTQQVKENPVSKKWDPDNSRLQRHVGLAVAHGVWRYHHMTGDTQFLEQQGAEIFLEICRFFASAAKQDSATGKYSIDKVMGPDEFHEAYPGAAEGGLRDNAYTNIMVSWAMEQAPKLLEAMSLEARAAVLDKIGLGPEELAHWADLRKNLRLCASQDGVLEQFDGFFKLEPLSREFLERAEREVHGRVDRLLKAEGMSPDLYQCAKQADFLMAPWVLGIDESQRIMEELLGQPLPADWLQKNYEFYVARTAHGSTLSRLVHGEIALRAGIAGEGLPLYNAALKSDFDNTQNTTQEGIHMGVMVGTVWQAMSLFGGLDLRGEVPSFDPRFPESWNAISYGFYFRGQRYDCEISPESLRIKVDGAKDDKLAGVTVIVQGERKLLKVGEWHEFPLTPNLIATPTLPVGEL